MGDKLHAQQTPQHKPEKGGSDGRALRKLRVSLPLAIPALILVSYVLVLMSGFDGFGHPMGIYRPLPIYIVLSLCLLYVQAVLWDKHQPIHFILFLTMGLAAIVFAGIYFILGAKPIINGPPLYYIANFALFGGFIFDAVRRRFSPAPGVPSPAAATVVGHTAAKGGTRRRRLIRNIAIVGADSVGLGVLAVLAGGAVYQFEHGVPLLRFVYTLDPALQPVGVGGNGSIPSPIPLPNTTDLWQFDVVLGVPLALIVGSLSLAIVAAMVRGSQTPEQMGRVLREAGTQILDSLRLIGIIPWLAASSVVALLAKGLTYYFEQLASETGNTMWDLINPFRNPYPGKIFNQFLPDLASFAVGILVAAALVIIAAVCTEFDVDIVYRTVSTLGAAGRSLSYVLLPMLAALTVANASAFHFYPTTPQPFQFSLTGLIALVLFVLVLVNSIVVARRERMRQPPSVAPLPFQKQHALH